MRGRMLKTITATTLAGIMLIASSGCGQTKANVIEQAEEKCDVLSEAEGRAVSVKFNQDEPSSEARCMIRLMPREARSAYEADVDENPYYKQGEYTHDGYSYQWTISGQRDRLNSVTLSFVEQ